MKNSLVAYKGKPARITDIVESKFALEFADGATLKVREKDFRFIHPEFTTVNEDYSKADFEMLAEFQEETLTLQEITEWLFDEYTAQNAWCVCLMVEDGLYFYWQKDRIFVRPTSQIENIQAKRDAEKLAAQSLTHCVENLSNNTFNEADEPYLKEIARVALNQSKTAKILAQVGVENTPDAAYQLLLKIKYFAVDFNPYPARFAIPKDEEIAVKVPEIERVDLTHLTCYAIDNDGSNDADDAISIDGNTLWVHVADVANIVPSGSDLDVYAQERGSNFYLPNEIIHMLPVSVTEASALGATEKSDALSFSFEFDGENINNIKVMQSVVCVTNTTYEAVDEMLMANSNEDLARIKAIGEAHKKYRDAQGSINLHLPNVDVRLVDGKVIIAPQATSASRDLVAEMMVMAGRTMAQFTNDNLIPVPYALQDKGDFDEEFLAKKDALTLSESFLAIKNFKRSAISVKPLLHYGLGLPYYLRVTSPMRRYYDLLAHQQIINFINDKPMLEVKRVKEIIGSVNMALADVGRVDRFSKDHFKCVFLMQNPKWLGTGIVVDTRGDKALFMIPELGMMTQIKFKNLPKLDEEMQLQVTRVNLVDKSANFKVT
ncbi:ribonuclease catalytic domain-containing protein [Bathymodiolus septemdierum thioautotrophic gill symbiont]|uniref:Exoribonuclease II n=1 Tax=endosymbiont of Bathymodiolus septemdierum str. Myojin knoll TaxID=1303921 RepID=A0A0P0USY9_9GAMM|nr:ribonuclease catalytic domain-containing protein [Bathymodiolus septemdierum thioautotrophic gill symbiont]BAS68281.1 exoribonuclease II [endosymbiont of Bathymodiolus septemdierum str. Myojin knoll]